MPASSVSVITCDIFSLDTESTGGACLTVRAHVSRRELVAVVTVVVVVPVLRGVTSPVLSTVATVGRDDFHVTDLSVALSGKTVSVSRSVVSIVSVAVV
jgi:hypothetical protein